MLGEFEDSEHWTLVASLRRSEPGKRTLLTRSPVNIKPVTTLLPLGPKIPLPTPSPTRLRKRDQMTTAEEFGLCEASLTYNADPPSRNTRTYDARVVVPRVH